MSLFRCLVLIAWLLTALPVVAASWTTSRVVGSPEPPLPYVVRPVLTQHEWRQPLYVRAEPGTNWLVVVSQGGEGNRPARVDRVEDRAEGGERTNLLELSEDLIYSITFHPDYERNGHVFVFTNGPRGENRRRNRIVRYTIERESPQKLATESALVILEWRSEGHDGGDLAFGRDGMLYVTTGDGTSDSDGWLSGQDVTNLLGGVLRLDVDHAADGRPYSIPADNPFVNVRDARGELWAFGLRNPWRMGIDVQTGQVWVGNNGQDLWETVHLVERGDNLGWSVYEGNHPFYLNRPLGPAPFVPPTIEHHHTEARSLTGGIVYYGDVLPELNGAFVYGDFSTGKIWGARHNGTQLTWHRELADTSVQITGFGRSHRGDLLVVDHAGGLFRLEPAPAEEPAPPFPQRLSETGLYQSVAEHTMQPGVIAYQINAPAWHDGAQVERYCAVPGEGRIGFVARRGSWDFPEGTVLLQTLSLTAGEDAALPLRRIETRLLTRQRGEWQGYSYRWNDAQDDAVLVPSPGDELTLSESVGDSDGEPARKWRFPSRAECMSCHGRAAGFVLAIQELQLDRDHDDGHGVGNQIEQWVARGVFKNEVVRSPVTEPRLVDPYDSEGELDARARTYLHVNCAGCHVEAGGGNARMELGLDGARDGLKVINQRPQHDTFGIDNAMLVAAGDPDRSVLWHRISRRGRGQMPPLVSQVVDERAVDLIGAWIRSLPAEPTRFVRDWQLEDFPLGWDSDLAQRPTRDAGAQTVRQLGCLQCHRFLEQGGGAGPRLDGIAGRLQPQQLLESILEPDRQVAPEFASTLIVTVDGRTIQGRVEEETAEQVVVRTADSFANSVVIPQAQIEERRAVSGSLMPRGMLNGLERDEILDLLAYLLASGSP